MTNESAASLMLVLAKGMGAGRVAVDLQSFLDYSDQMDEELRKLEERWSSWVTPSTQLAGVLRNRR